MTQQGEYERGARVGLGIKLAHEAALLAQREAAGNYETYLAALIALTPGTVDHVVETQARYLVADAFPGSEVQQAQPFPPLQPTPPPLQAAQPNPAPAPYQAPAPAQPVPPYQPPPGVPYPNGTPAPVEPTPIPNAGSAQDQEEERLWRLYFSDPSAWHDNRLDKRNPKAPDFKHKSMPDPANPQYKVSLWLNNAPQWVKQHMGVQ